MCNSILELQKKFNLFKVGDKRQGMIVSEINDSMQVKLQGGVLGYIDAQSKENYSKAGIFLSVGRSLEFEIAEIKSGIPYLVLTEQYVLCNSEHKARVRCLGTQGVVVEFLWNRTPNIGFYSPKQGLPKELFCLEENDKVLCKGLHQEQDYYLVEKIRLEPQEEVVDEEKLKVFELPESWSDEQARKYVSENGGFLSKGAYQVGKCYVGTALKRPFVQFSDGSKASITKINNDKEFPFNGDKILVRMLKIYEFGDLKDVELLDIVDDEYVQLFTQKQDKKFLPELLDTKQKNRHTTVDSGYIFGQRDDEIFNEGKTSGSEVSFERYWLGFLYIAKIQDGQPVLLDNGGNRIAIELIENLDYSVLSDENVAFVRLHYIKKEAQKVTFTMNVEFVREKKPQDESYFS